jgi:ElaB/YqjD/DUF883 family membrane-anchored ribosome-binding protein
MATTHDPLAASNSGSVSNTGNTANSVKDKISDAASQIKNTASQYGSTAVNQIDSGVRGAAGALHSTADRLRSQVGSTQGGKVADIAQTAASKLDSTAQALQDFDTRQAFAQFESWTRQNPGIAIGGALAIGFFLGMTLRSSDSDRSVRYSGKYDY